MKIRKLWIMKITKPRRSPKSEQCGARHLWNPRFCPSLFPSLNCDRSMGIQKEAKEPRYRATRYDDTIRYDRIRFNEFEFGIWNLEFGIWKAWTASLWLKEWNEINGSEKCAEGSSAKPKQTKRERRWRLWSDLNDSFHSIVEFFLLPFSLKFNYNNNNNLTRKSKIQLHIDNYFKSYI